MFLSPQNIFRVIYDNVFDFSINKLSTRFSYIKKPMSNYTDATDNMKFQIYLYLRYGQFS